MRQGLIAVVLIGLAGSAMAQDAWEWIGPEFTNTAVIAVDEDGAIFIGGYGMGTLVSEDQGANWTAVSGPSDPTEMVATPLGTVVSTDMVGYGLLVTDDKGATWSRVIVHDEHEWVTQLAVHPLTGDLYAAVNSGGGLHYSTDGGFHWQPVATSPLCTDYWDLEAGGNASIWVKGDDSLWRSDDYGANWLELGLPVGTDFGGRLAFAPSFALFLTGFDSETNAAHLLRSWDFGATWTELTTGLPGPEWGCYGDIVFGHDWGTALLADDCNGLYRSSDMGDNWAPYNEGLAATDVIGLVNGPTGAHYAASMAGGVFRNLRDVVAVPEAPSPSRATLAQNRPNPFNPRTTISFTLGASGPVRLTLHDARGRRLRTLASGFHEAGTHTLEFDAARLGSGVYFYRLEANGEVQARKLTVVE